MDGLAGQKKPPELTQDLLVELGGWPIFREARRLVEAGAVKESRWDGTVLIGLIRIGGRELRPRLDLRSTVFAEARCSCDRGRRGVVCEHTVALGIHRMQAGQVPAVSTAVETTRPEVSGSDDIRCRSLVLAKERGMKLSFRLLLPPNIAATAPKDVIMVKLEADVEGRLQAPESLDRGRAYRMDANTQTVAGLVESWCGGRLHGMLQLSRRQLFDLLELFKDQPTVYRADDRQKPLNWETGRIPPVYALLEQAPAKPSTTEEPARPLTFAPEAIQKKPVSTAPTGFITLDGSQHYLAATLPSRDCSGHSRFLALLKREGFRVEPSNGRWWLRDRHKTLSFLARYQRSLQAAGELKMTEAMEKRLADVSFAPLTCTIEQRGRDFISVITWGREAEQQRAIESAWLRGQHYLEWQGTILLLDPADAEKMEQTRRTLSCEAQAPLTTRFEWHISSRDLADAAETLEPWLEGANLPSAWIERSARLRDPAQWQAPEIDQRLRGMLRDYQKQGVGWMWHLCSNDLGGILADEMGLGKTVQALAIIDAIRRRESGARPALVVAPAALVENWCRESKRFLPDLRVFRHHGTSRLADPALLAGYDLVITAYRTLSLDRSFFRECQWSLVLIDEAQHVKNPRTRDARSLRELRSPCRLALTGTPLENRLSDIQALFDFIMPGYLSNPPAALGRDERSWLDQRMVKRVAPYILRRTKKVVAPELPDVQEQIVYCSMDEEQAIFYDTIKRKAQDKLMHIASTGGGRDREYMAALSELLRLRQTCADPRLVDEETRCGSTKLDAFLEILEEARDGGHRMLVFSQFVKLLHCLRGELDARDIPYAYLDGSVRNRVEVCEQFNNNPECPLMLISLKAGGTGLNLTGADTVVHFDPWWNPAAEAQATARAHRIGQKNTVTSIKLIVTGSVEEKVLAMQQNKAALLKDLFEASEEALAPLDWNVVRELLE